MKAAAVLFVVAFVVQQTLGKPGLHLGEFGNRIIGGRDASPGQFPYQVSVSEIFGHACGGAIVNEFHVVIAAHCILFTTGPYSVRVGVTNVRTDPVVTHRVSKTIIHPKNDRAKNDIAILVLETPIEFSETVQPIPLGREWIDEGVVAIASGFGRTVDGGGLSDELQHVNLTILSNEYCRYAYRNSANPVTDDMICTGGQNGGMCNGDSGGPLVVDGKLIGVISWGMRPCGSGMPDVYSRVSSYVEWILATTKISKVGY